MVTTNRSHGRMRAKSCRGGSENTIARVSGAWLGSVPHPLVDTPPCPGLSGGWRRRRRRGRGEGEEGGRIPDSAKPCPRIQGHLEREIGDISNSKVPLQTNSHTV